MGFLEDLASLTTLRRAWESVAAKRGTAGIDRVSVSELAARLDQELETLSQEIGNGSYRPLPVLRIRPSFLTASERALVVPAVRDRVVLRAIADLLAPKIDPILSPACRAFRKGSSARSTADDVGRWIEQGAPWVLRTDIKSFFDSIRPEILRGKLEPFVDAEGLAFLDRVIRCRIFDREEVSDQITGIAQGSPLSPLLANLYLDELDRNVEKEHGKYIRYCDDLLILGQREEEVSAAREQVAQLLGPLGLTLNEEKTRICRAEDGFVFLGYHFGPAGRGPAVKAVEALRYRLEEIAGSPEPNVEEVDALYRGWTSYFGAQPQCWTGSPVGILALLRSGETAGSGDIPQRLADDRWNLRGPVSPWLALRLAEAWSARGREDQAWLEMAAACGGSRSHLAETDGWSGLLGLDASRLGALARRLVGSPAERSAVLSEAVAELGRYDLAARLASAPILSAAEPEAPPVGEGISEADIRFLAGWFQGREGVHAMEAVDRAGHRSFLPVHRPLLEEDWKAHLRGEKTLALPLVRTGDTALLGVLDVDLEKRILDERPGELEGLLGRALGTALKLRAELQRRGALALLEFSGHKGYHLWLRLAEPMACHQLRRWLLEVVRAIGPLPEGVRVEEFPNRDRLRFDAVGPLVKLPLGIHSRTGRRCSLLDDRGQELAEPLDAIRALPGTPVETVCLKAPDTVMAVTTADCGSVGPRAQKILDGCHVLGFLAKKVGQTSYLNHRERWSLLCALGHLGDEGRSALHAIISQTYNYQREVTDRQIDRLPPWPISCPKLRELHPEAAAVGTCKCQFDLRGRGYPTPVLYALRPSEVPAFRAVREPRKEGVSQVDALRQTVEEKVAKIAELKRHRKGVEAALERCQAELASLFEEQGTERLQLTLGVLRRVQGEDGKGWEFVIEV